MSEHVTDQEMRDLRDYADMAINGQDKREKELGRNAVGWRSDTVLTLTNRLGGCTIGNPKGCPRCVAVSFYHQINRIIDGSAT